MSTIDMLQGYFTYRYSVGKNFENADKMFVNLSLDESTWVRIDERCCSISNFEVGVRNATIPSDFLNQPTVHVRLGVDGFTNSNEYLVVRGVTVNATTCTTPSPTAAPTSQPTPLPTNNPTPVPTAVPVVTDNGASAAETSMSPSITAASSEFLPGQTTGGKELVDDAKNAGSDATSDSDDDGSSLLAPVLAAVAACVVLVLIFVVAARKRRARESASSRTNGLSTSTVRAGPSASDRAGGPAAQQQQPGAKRRSRSSSKSKRTPTPVPAGGTYSSVSDAIAGAPNSTSGIYTAAPAGGQRTTTGTPSQTNDMYGPITTGRPASGTYRAVSSALRDGSTEPANVEYGTLAPTEPTDIQYGTLAPDEPTIVYSSI